MTDNKRNNKNTTVYVARPVDAKGYAKLGEFTSVWHDKQLPQ